MDFGSIAGFAFASGVTYLVLPTDMDEIHKPILTAGAIGATAGFATLYLIVGDDEPAAQTENAAIVPRLMPFAGPAGERGLALVGQF